MVSGKERELELKVLTLEARLLETQLHLWEVLHLKCPQLSFPIS